MPTPSEALQTAIFEALTSDPAVTAIVGARVHDGRPTEYPAITFGPFDYVPEDMDCIDGRTASLQLDCWARDGSKRLRPAKELADTVVALLHNIELDLGTHALTRLSVDSVRTFMDADGLTGHGIVVLEAEIEAR